MLVSARNLVNLLSYGLLFCLLVTTSVNADSTSTDIDQSDTKSLMHYNVYLTLADQHGTPNSEDQRLFNCTDKIYTVIELENFSVGKHRLRVDWIDPDEKVREVTQYPFEVESKKVRLWAWLKLSRAQGAALMKWFDPAVGLEDFIGDWKIKVKVNQQPLDELDFKVRC